METKKSDSRLGLIFTGGEGPLPAQCVRVVEEARGIARGEPVIAAADSGLILAESASVTPDWIAGDMDSLGKDAGRLAAYPPENVLQYPEDKDFTDTELAFFLLKEKGCEKIWILGGGGGRLDQLFGLRSLFERDNPPERWLTTHDDIRCIEGESSGISADAKSSTGAVLAPVIPSVLEHRRSTRNEPLFPVSVFPLGIGPWEAESSGLKWPLAGLPWSRDFIAISNVALEGHFSIKAKQGRFLIMVPYP